MRINRLGIWLICLLLFLAACSQENKSDVLFEQSAYTFPYQINTPNKTWKLPKELVEISALSFIDGQRVACIQDEKGNIYIFNTESGKVESKTVFGDDGDFEGIEIIGNDAWVLKSNGDLYQVKDFLTEKHPKVKRHKTVLSGKNNTEGLGYDPEKNILLIACKGYPFPDDKNKNAAGYKAVYRFDPESGKLNKTPELLISLDSIKQYKNYSTITSAGIKLLAFFDASEGDVSFKPSAIAIHPQTGNLYIISSAGKTLAVFSRKGKMLALIQLESKIHKQPEGIGFDDKGTLYISNEGGDDKGLILRFDKNSGK